MIRNREMSSAGCREITGQCQPDLAFWYECVGADGRGLSAVPERLLGKPAGHDASTFLQPVVTSFYPHRLQSVSCKLHGLAHL